MTEKTLAKKLADETFALYHTGYFNKTWEDDGKLIVDGLEQHFIEVIATDHQPAFAVGEYRAYKDHIYKITEDHETYICCAELVDGVLISHSGSYKSGGFYHGSKPATAEQIATFRRADLFAAKGRKLDEFRVGDTVDICGDEVKVTEVNVWGMNVISIDINGINRHVEAGAFDLIQTAEELQEVENNE